jgi:hypothetical protein
MSGETLAFAVSWPTNRLTIEAIASRKYDAGQSRPVLDEADV